MAERYAFFGEAERSLLAKYAPGPLTVVVPVRPGALSSFVTAGGPTVAIRIPDSEIALELVRRVGVGLAAPSANRSSRPSPTDAVQAIEEVGGQVAAVLDGGPCRVGIESTVVEIRDGFPVILRPGKITYDEIARVVDGCRGDKVGFANGATEKAECGDAAQESARSPGTRYRHYAPDIPVRVIEPTQRYESGGRLKGLVLAYVPYATGGERRAIDDLAAEIQRFGGNVVCFESYDDLSVEFYRFLSRWEGSATEIWVTTPPDEQRYSALRDRLFRAAGIV